MKTYAIAAIPGDGIGTEVVAAGLEALDAIARRDGGFTFKVDHFDWGGEYYKKHGRMMPANVIERAQLPVLAPRHDDGLACEVSGKEVPLVPHLASAPHDLPAFREHTLPFEFVNARIEVPRRRNRPGVVQRIIRIVKI